MSKGMSIDDFLGHNTRGKSDRAAYLDNWKNRKPPYVDTFLHTKAPIYSLWQHPWPRLVERERDGVKTREVWSGTFNSWEPEEVLKNQYRRDRDTGERDMPPTICPMSLTIEMVYALVHAGDIHWCDPLFRFEGDDAAKAKVLHAGGLWNAFGKKDLAPELKAEMSRAKIFAKDAWQENMQAKCNYIMCVVDVSAPEKGVQIATNGTLLGDCVKSLIHDAMTAEGEDAGNPLKNPYCIRWEYKPTETEFNKKYKAIRMTKIHPTDAIMALIEGEPPDTSRLTDRGNITELRQSMEEHYVGDYPMPWDEIFEPSERALSEEQKSEGKPSQARAAQAKRPTPAEVTTRTQGKVKAAQQAVQEMTQPVAKAAPKAAAKQAPAPAESADDSVECDQCEGEMAATDMVCPHCGYDYSPAEPEPAPEPVAPPKRTRSGASAPTQAAPAASATPKRRVNF